MTYNVFSGTLNLTQSINLDTLSNAVWYSTFDLRSGFHQVPVNSRDVNITTFVCHRGTYTFPKTAFLPL